MPRRIDPDLLAALKIEFEHAIRPSAVIQHLRDIGCPVPQSQIYRYYNQWHESGSLFAEPDGQMDRPRVWTASYFLGRACIGIGVVRFPS